MKKKAAKKETRVVDPVVVEGIIASMVPIPGKDFKMGKFHHLGFRLCADRRAACNDGPPSAE